MRILLQDHNRVIADVAKEFEITQKIDEAERVVLWNEVTPDCQAIIRLAHILKKKVVVIQHGRKGSSRYFYPFNEKIICDKLCVWGQKDKDRLVEVGNPPEKIEITSTTIFSHLIPRQKHKEINILFSPDHWDKEIPENIRARDELRKLKKYNIITKIIDGQIPETYDNPVFSNRKDEEHLKICAEVLAKTDIMVAISEGTLELMAQYLDIPVIIIKDWELKSFGGDTRYADGYWRHISEASKSVALKDLTPAIKQQIKNPNELQKERQKICLEEGGINVKDPLRTICDIIKKG